MTGFAIVERRRASSCRPILRLAPCGIALSAQGGHSRLAWRLKRHLDGAHGCQPCRCYLAHHAPALLARILEFFGNQPRDRSIQRMMPDAR
jgi:hypothetical protein